MAYSPNITSSPYRYASTDANGIMGTSGSVLTTGASGLTWALTDNITYTHVQDESALKIDGELILNGTSVDKRLTKIEDYFGIINTNDKLEDRWEELKKLGEEYRKLEAHLLKKEQVISKLKND